jgi:hypothetical protein
VVLVERAIVMVVLRLVLHVQNEMGMRNAIAVIVCKCPVRHCERLPQ